MSETTLAIVVALISATVAVLSAVFSYVSAGQRNAFEARAALTANRLDWANRLRDAVTQAVATHSAAFISMKIDDKRDPKIQSDVTASYLKMRLLLDANVLIQKQVMIEFDELMREFLGAKKEQLLSGGAQINPAKLSSAVEAVIAEEVEFVRKIAKGEFK